MNSPLGMNSSIDMESEEDNARPLNTQPLKRMSILSSISSREINEIKKESKKVTSENLPEDIWAIFADKKQSKCRKMWLSIRYLSLFKYRNGIFHKKKLSYVSKCSLFGSTLLIIMVSIYMYYLASQFGDQQNLM